ncbi:uncharacterized protein [Aristolochia californica]|uniref:uncharacterized protein n=1 Tax=Aristolochia californica TaxID=171875 RepID=UPI0035DF6FC2
MDPTHQLLPSDSPFPSSSRNINLTSRSPKRNLSTSQHRTTFPPVKTSDPSLVDIHSQVKVMTISGNSALSKPKSKRSLVKGLQVQPPQQPGSTTAADIKQMSKKGFTKPSAAQKMSDEKRCEGGEKRLVLLDGGRRSFCGSDVEVGCLFARVGARIVAKDMPPFMQIHAVTCARKAYDGLEKFSSKALALTLKKEFDKVYGPAWHCIVGSSFGSFVTHSVGGFLYFSLEKVHILLFKTAVQKAD